MSTNFLVRKPCANNTFGIEIEGYVLDRWDREMREYYQKFFFFTTDGSLRPPIFTMSGVEIVSQPLPLKALKRAIDKLFSVTLADADWCVNERAGIHVHVSRKYLSNKKAKAIAIFLRDMSREDCATVFGREPNDYCEQQVGNHSKYVQVNMLHSDTVEFRVFASGNAAWAKYCVDCVDYLIKHAYHLNIDALLAFRSLYKL